MRILQRRDVAASAAALTGRIPTGGRPGSVVLARWKRAPRRRGTRPRLLSWSTFPTCSFPTGTRKESGGGRWSVWLGPLTGRATSGLESLRPGGVVLARWKRAPRRRSTRPSLPTWSTFPTCSSTVLISCVRVGVKPTRGSVRLRPGGSVGRPAPGHADPMADRVCDRSW